MAADRAGAGCSRHGRRQPGSAKIFALAYALQGEWTMAKTVAAQDIPADQVDARVQQWMAFAKPTRLPTRSPP